MDTPSTFRYEDHASSLLSTDTFAQVIPGSPTVSLQSVTTFVFQFKRYVAYISGSQLNIFSSPSTVVQAVRFPRNLVAIVADEDGGRIAVASGSDVTLLEPLTEGWTKIWWEKALTLRREDAGDEGRWLSWGNDGELLVGGTRALSLFSILPASRSHSPSIQGIAASRVEEREALWSIPVPSPIRQAEFSPTAALVASCSRYDRLVKIWRRLSFEEGLFDHAYLSHPGAITHLQWRPSSGPLEERRSSGRGNRHIEEPEVLYTIASDGLLRVWHAGGLHDSDILTIYTTVDLISAIPQSPSLPVKGRPESTRSPRYAVVLPSHRFCAAVNTAIGIVQSDTVNHAKELLKEMVSKEPDVILTFDGNGRMSAWGLQSVGHKRRPESPNPQNPVETYHIAHAEGLDLMVPHASPAVCTAWFQDGSLHILVHALANQADITWRQANIEAFFSTSAGSTERISSLVKWTGHDDLILDVKQCGSGLLSRSSKEAFLWQREHLGLLTAQWSLKLDPDVLAVTAIEAAELTLTARPETFTLSNFRGQEVAKATCDVTAAGTFYITHYSPEKILGVFIQDDAKLVVRWTAMPGEAILETESFTSQDDIVLDNYCFVLAVSDSPDIRQKLLVGITQGGRIDRFELPHRTLSRLVPEPCTSLETHVSEPSIFSASNEVAAVASRNRNELVIVGLVGGYVEHRQLLGREILNLRCFAPRPQHNFLALIFSTTVDILAQGRYDCDRDVPVWLQIRTISINGLGPKLASVDWMADGELALAAGNSVFVAKPIISSKNVNEKTKKAVALGLDQDAVIHLFSLTQRLNDPLPVWHPSMLSYLVQYGHIKAAMNLLKRLAQKMKFWGSGEELDPTLEESPQRLLHNLGEHEAHIENEVMDDLREQLAEKVLPRTSEHEHRHMIHIIDALAYLQGHLNALDIGALRYLFIWKMQLLSAQDKACPSHSDRSGHLNDAEHDQQFVPKMGWREICFAYHSTTQQPLLDILVSHYDNKLTWWIARRLGLMAWLVEREALEQVFEQTAQTAYRSQNPPDPVDASLFYLALHRKSTLLALWRIATWHKEQRTTTNFLKRDFTQPNAKTAAKKNAYALMGKRRFHYCAAFFLLADDAASATSILAGQCEDPAFAIAVARLYCGDGSAVLRELLDERILPRAREDGDRWLMSWCHSVLQENRLASDVLVQPLSGVRTWHQDDPGTILLYRHLRKTPSEYEYDAVLRAARILRRMGLWLLALELVSNWEFKPTSQPSTASVTHQNARGLLNGVPSKQTFSEHWSSNNFVQPTLANATAADDKSVREAKAAELLAKIKAKREVTPAAAISLAGKEKQREPTQFKEPDANSLLDSFGL